MPKFLNRQERWWHLGAIGVVERTRRTAGKLERNVSFFVTSLTAGIDRSADAVRRHWGIENSLHWVLDVAFAEDLSRARVGFEAENFTVLRHFTLNMLKLEISVKDGISGKRQRAGWDDDYMRTVFLAGAALN